MGQPKLVNLFSMCASWRCQTTAVQEQKQQQPQPLGAVNKDLKGNKFIKVSVRAPCQLWTFQASSPADQKAEKSPGYLSQSAADAACAAGKEREEPECYLSREKGTAAEAPQGPRREHPGPP